MSVVRTAGKSSSGKSIGSPHVAQATSPLPTTAYGHHTPRPRQPARRSQLRSGRPKPPDLPPQPPGPRAPPPWPPPPRSRLPTPAVVPGVVVAVAVGYGPYDPPGAAVVPFAVSFPRCIWRGCGLELLAG